jgi:hypothetical protein
VLCGQLRKLETICSALRANAKKVREGIADLPGLKLRKSGDIEGDLGMRVFLDWGNRERRDRFLRAVRAEGISAGRTGRVGDPAGGSARRQQGDGPSRLAVVQFARRPGHPVRRRMLPADDRHPQPPRRRDDRSQVHRAGRADVIAAIRKVYLAMHA